MRFGPAALLILLMTLSCGNSDQRITVATPFGPLAYPLAYMASRSDGDMRIELTVWKNPDQLRAMIAGGQADYYALPVNVAALFHNRGIDLALLDVSVWGVLWLVSTDSTRTDIGNFRGETVITPFRGDIPHFVFTTLLQANGLDPDNDINMTYASTPFDAIQQLLGGNVKHAVLSEPECSILMHRTAALREEMPELPRLYRAVSLEAAWGARFDVPPELPLGGLAASPETAVDRDLTDTFLARYRDAVSWCTSHPDSSAMLVASRFEGIDAAPVAEASRHIRQHSVSAADARPAIERFFNRLLEGTPETIGGRMPSSSFYYNGNGEPADEN